MKRYRSRRMVTLLLLFGLLALPGSRAAASTHPAPLPGCTYNACVHLVLKLLKADRAQHGLTTLKLMGTLSHGRSSCLGSYGHSVAMAETGAIWHVNARFPLASFPQDICGTYGIEGENIAESASGNVVNDLQAVYSLMTSEPHDSATCSATVNHACNILNGNFRKVGIGIYYHDGTTWLTEDFVG